MALTVCTGMWGPKRATYEAIFSAAFERFWPSDVRLAVFTDDVAKAEKKLVQAACGGAGTLGPKNGQRGSSVRSATYGSLHDCHGWREFVLRHQDEPAVNGRRLNHPRPWKPKDLQVGYNFRFDAVRFAGQAFIPEAVAHGMLDGEVLCWLDADVVAHKPVPAGFVESLVDGADGAYLGRAPKHSEIGFWAVRLNEHTRALLMAFADAYRTDALLTLREWHSAFVWDDTRRWAEGAERVQLRNLTPGGSGHVWHQSPLRLYLDHLKGDRKAAGRSRERRA